ncbi:hypothetical protein RRG08_033129 [Elysia crispata]|uniref:Uncharacterized protein n=1 Tax=Elysia crispata TaxID=231223 RepID=A0AAE1CQQ9_9GAST|nr:hypothetical protein RRG08_033129 [Elysia crispata]
MGTKGCFSSSSPTGVARIAQVVLIAAALIKSPRHSGAGWSGVFDWRNNTDWTNRLGDGASLYQFPPIQLVTD